MPKKSKALITAIIPIRLSKEKLYDEVERIDRIVATLPDMYSVIIVDYGTDSVRSKELKDAAERNNIELVRVETEREPFSIGAARDIGTQHSKTPLVMYHDIDFLMSTENYLRVVSECRLRDMPQNAYAFFALPGAYLTREFTERYLELHSSGDASFADALVHDGVMRHEKKVFEHSTFAISAIVANRHHLLAIGGHDTSFTGHGAEDFELMHRLTSYYERGPRPHDYYKNTKNNSILEYEGFRAFYALYGIDVFQRGTVIAHLWHPRRQDFGYVGTSNQVRVSKTMREFDDGLTSIPPLQDETSGEFTLVLIQPGTMPARALRHAMPALGRFRAIPEKSFADAASLLDFVRSERFTRVFFLNPYGNEHRLSLYRSVKETGIRFVAYDRGALPDSWFFDTEGFLGESQSYARGRWDNPLSHEDRNKTLEWIDRLNLSDNTLEKNGSRIGADHLRQKLHIGDRKVIFVALQRPSDTATIYFSGPCQDAGTFNEWVSQLATSIDSRRYVVIAKKHPLETQRPEIENVTFVDDDTHIKDLIDLADKLVLINSGSGLIAATLGKPVICCGNAFYAHSGFTFEATTPDELVDLAQSDLSVDEETKLRFVKYLVFDFYSFGKTEYLDKVAPDGSLRRLARRTVYSHLRGLTSSPIELGEEPKGISLDAPLFYSFGGRKGIKAISEAKKAKIAAPAPPLPPVRQLSTLRRPLVPIIRPVVRALGTKKKDVQKFEADPAGFFANLKNPAYRVIGSLLFPVRSS
ncbi:hypothetical protein [Rhizobium mongolense]|uniref:Glycosyltransferase involved in capsule biosynthesis n=2 Tax=Rhizobium mongolense TaxID=57676 RepID=A0ABR6IV41_9HYPH|nr:hypothetical protein [Rhizobium mongolense]MBB4231771.1 putative glycosyltransferase involved in capsule biosynthesis [Rhizobium mongolense]TVZ66733.1 putative glycosyltransferase involved in capsule biosynthesis [Rhizobium mongolense USDA 1844]